LGLKRVNCKNKRVGRGIKQWGMVRKENYKKWGKQ